jgi:hypothetical protein
VESLRKKLEESRRAARGLNSESNTNAANTPNASTPPSRSGSPSKHDAAAAAGGDKSNQAGNGHRGGDKIEYENGEKRSFMDSNFVRRAHTAGDDDMDRNKRKKHGRRSSRSVVETFN